MLRSSPELRALEARFDRDSDQRLSLVAAQARFAALWAEARALNPDLGRDWLADLDADFAVARAVNGLPPESPTTA